MYQTHRTDEVKVLCEKMVLLILWSFVFGLFSVILETPGAAVHLGISRRGDHDFTSLHSMYTRKYIPVLIVRVFFTCLYR